MSSNPCVIIRTNADRQRAAKWCENAPDGCVVEFRQKRRSLDQNAALWSALTQVAHQRPLHNGVRMGAVTYKALFMHALGQEVQFIPSLDGASMVPLGMQSSKLTKAQFSDLLELIMSWAAQEGLTIEHFDEQAAA